MTSSTPAAPLVTVLLVEDDHTSRRAITRFLERKDYAVIRARNGAEAVRHLTAGVAAVITDLVMPRMDGMALLRVARENAPHTPVIMMTGQGSEKVAVEALKAGAFHYLVKPVNPEELLHLLRQAVEKYAWPWRLRAFIDEIAERNERSTREISPEALAQLEGFDWPGNVRQLKNMLESIIVLSSRDTIDVVDLPDKVRGVLPQPSPSSVIQPGMTLEEIQREAIRQALVRAGGNRAEAARLLGMSERTLYRRIEEYGLD